jgi:hypothetical protein
MQRKRESKAKWEENERKASLGERIKMQSMKECRDKTKESTQK